MAESKPSTSNYTSIQWSQPCRQIEYPEILLATENFNESLVIGCGGFGKVYKGNINNGSKLVVAAIKRLDSMSDQGETEFWAEVEMLSKLHHAYLVSLIGYCSYEKEFILVYEYMPNGTLSDHLHKLGTHLSWLKRLRICIGAGRGLDYLHTGTGIEFGVIHRDVKSSNILLNERWAAKVSDFGLSRISPANQPSTYVNTLIKGTFGYLDPNYFATGKLTRKSDVYAFGVVLFEVLCRKRTLDPSLDWGLATWAQDSIKEGNMKHMIDYDIKSQISPKCLKEFVRIAQRCLDNHPKHRPTMGEVVVGLESILTLQEKQTSGKTLFGRMIDMFPFPSKPENSDIPISSNFVTCVSVETLPPTRLDVYQTKNLEDLDTHNLALNAIIAALEDESKQIIGIYGIGGVGKTTLAMEVAARVKKTNMLFAAVAFTTVSQNIDVDKIKKDIGEATKRIMNGDKILIILDDVWEKLNLEELCIPYGSNYMNCKILLTSRSEKVCQKMNARSKICVNSLPTKEAWILFKRVVGERVETDANLKPVALKVVEECGGLPLLIQAVGNALKDERIESWSRALTQLQKHAPSDIDEEIRKSFIHLKLSYDYLKSEQVKSCFLLCSLFPEDTDISLEDLVHYGVGLERFADLDSIEDARDRVQIAVNTLTSSGLLLNSKWQGRTKMHDVVRDVALLIASQGNNKFLVEAGEGLTEWLPRDTSLESYVAISLVYNDIKKLPEYKVDVPDLEIFLVHENYKLSKISDEFIGCMKNLKVLDISWNDISSLPQSFQLLKKLRTLDLRGNKSLREISILGELKDLEILILNETGIIEIPKEIAQLVNLRVLQVKDCMNLCRIKQGVISALSILEELCIDLSRMTKGVNGCIEEVMKLLMLTYLELKVGRFDLIPEGFNLENLKGFLIQIGEINDKLVLRRSDRSLVISGEHLMIPLLKWLKKLIVVSRPHIFLFEIENLNNVMPTLYDEGFNELEHIELNDCSNVSCLVDDGIKRCDGVEGETEEKFFNLKLWNLINLKHLKLWNLINLKVLWKCPDEYISLTNLVTISIFGCNKLVRVFTVSVAQGLINLKKLDIVFCNGLKEVIWGGEDDDQSENVIVFPSLVEISFFGLTSLKSFYPGNFSIKYPSLVEVNIRYCKSMEIWGPGIHETPNLKTLVVNGGVSIAVDGPFAINKAVEKSQAAAAAERSRG